MWSEGMLRNILSFISRSVFESQKTLESIFLVKIREFISQGVFKVFSFCLLDQRMLRMCVCVGCVCVCVLRLCLETITCCWGRPRLCLWLDRVPHFFHVHPPRLASRGSSFLSENVGHLRNSRTLMVMIKAVCRGYHKRVTHIQQKMVAITWDDFNKLQNLIV